ncbi:MAG TPA: hypothetical protein VHI10_19250 [Mycobacterium sp.]|nr:hypothetical protein [Mycobacterium sp.]
MIDCVGLWRRTLLIDADGSRDTGTHVRWLQGTTAYVDSRGFAGRLGRSGDIFEWSRLIDIEPPGLHPDAGRMHWEAETLVEVGVYAEYVEHWVRDGDRHMPCWALFADDAILMRVGDLFGWADGAGVVVGAIGAAEWLRVSPRMHGSELEAKGVRWKIKDSEGNVNL